MQKLGILASVLLLASVIVAPIGLSYAQTVDTAKAAKSKLDETKAQMDQAKADRLAAQIQKAADIKAKMNAKKEAAAKDLAAAIAARNAAMGKEDLPTTADVVAKIRAMAAEQIEARKAAGGPSKVQVALEEDRAAHAKRIAEHKMTIPATPDKDQKYVKEDKRGRDKTLKGYDATDQLSKESELKKENKKAEAIRAKEAAKMHYNRK
ncbi:MAG: hypothetical protein ACT4NT_06380 [Nitrososphaerota archaeon]